jgi:hypothetical protein
MVIVPIGFISGEGEIFQVTLETNKSVITSKDSFVISIHIKNISDKRRILTQDHAENIIDYSEYYLILYSINKNGMCEQMLPEWYQYAPPEEMDPIVLEPFQEYVMRLGAAVRDDFFYDHSQDHYEDHGRITIIFHEQDLFYPIPEYTNKIRIKFAVDSEIANPQNRFFLESNEIELQFIR